MASFLILRSNCAAVKIKLMTLAGYLIYVIMAPGLIALLVYGMEYCIYDVFHTHSMYCLRLDLA